MAKEWLVTHKIMEIFTANSYHHEPLLLHPEAPEPLLQDLYSTDLHNSSHKFPWISLSRTALKNDALLHLVDFIT